MTEAPVVRRIAVFRALQLGDMLCAVPALRSLRAGFPDARITLIGLPWASAFADRFHRYIDDFVPFPGWPGLPEREPEVDALPGFIELARGQRFDLAVQLHGNGIVANHVLAEFGARDVWGFKPRGVEPPVPGRFIEYPDAGHEIHRLLSLTEAMGLADTGDSLEFPVSDEESAEARLILRGVGIDGAFAIVHPGSSTSARRWPVEAFAEVVRHLSSRGLPVLITGTAEEEPMARSVRETADGGVVVAGRTTLGALAGLVERAALVVTNDTSVSHIAAALRTQSVVVFTGSDMARWAPLDRGRHRPVEGTSSGRAQTRRDEVGAVLREAEMLLAGEGAHVVA